MDEAHAETETVEIGAQHLPAGPAEEVFVKRRFFPKLKRVLKKVPFGEDAVALFYTAFDPLTPKWARRVAIGALAYFIMPFDIIPDMLVVAGYTDDASILALAIGMLAKHVTPVHRELARQWLADPH